MAHRGSFPPQPRVPRSPVTVPRWFLHSGSEPCSSLEHQVPGCWSALASPVTCAGEDLGLEEMGLQQVRAEVCLASPRVCVSGVCVSWGSLCSTWLSGFRWNWCLEEQSERCEKLEVGARHGVKTQRDSSSSYPKAKGA